MMCILKTVALLAAWSLAVLAVPGDDPTDINNSPDRLATSKDSVVPLRADREYYAEMLDKLIKESRQPPSTFSSSRPRTEGDRPKYNVSPISQLVSRSSLLQAGREAAGGSDGQGQGQDKPKKGKRKHGKRKGRKHKKQRRELTEEEARDVVDDETEKNKKIRKKKTDKMREQNALGSFFSFMTSGIKSMSYAMLSGISNLFFPGVGRDLFITRNSLFTSALTSTSSSSQSSSSMFSRMMGGDSGIPGPLDESDRRLSGEERDAVKMYNVMSRALYSATGNKSRMLNRLAEMRETVIGRNPRHARDIAKEIIKDVEQLRQALGAATAVDLSTSLFHSFIKPYDDENKEEQIKQGVREAKKNMMVEVRKKKAEISRQVMHDLELYDNMKGAAEDLQDLVRRNIITPESAAKAIEDRIRDADKKKLDFCNLRLKEATKYLMGTIAGGAASLLGGLGRAPGAVAKMAKIFPDLAQDIKNYAAQTTSDALKRTKDLAAGLYDKLSLPAAPYALGALLNGSRAAAETAANAMKKMASAIPSLDVGDKLGGLYNHLASKLDSIQNKLGDAKLNLVKRRDEVAAKAKGYLQSMKDKLAKSKEALGALSPRNILERAASGLEGLKDLGRYASNPFAGLTDLAIPDSLKNAYGCMKNCYSENYAQNPNK